MLVNLLAPIVILSQVQVSWAQDTPGALSRPALEILDQRGMAPPYPVSCATLSEHLHKTGTISSGMAFHPMKHMSSCRRPRRCFQQRWRLVYQG